MLSDYIIDPGYCHSLVAKSNPQDETSIIAISSAAWYRYFLNHKTAHPEETGLILWIQAVYRYQMYGNTGMVQWILEV